MTAAEILARARQLGAAAQPRALAAARWAWANRTLVLAVAAVLLAALYFRASGRAATAEGQIAAANARAEEEAAARKAGVPVVQVVPQPVVNDEAERALAARPELLAERDRLKREVKQLRAFLVVRGETAPIPATGPARPGEPAPASPPPPSEEALGDPLPPVLLRRGDELRFSLVGVGLEGEKGARTLLLSIGATRVDDGVELGRGPLSVPLTSAFAPPDAGEAVPPARRWRIGPLGGITPGGWLVGAAGTYRLQVWRWTPEALLAAGAGTGGGFLTAGFLF